MLIIHTHDQKTLIRIANKNVRNANTENYSPYKNE